MESQFSKLELEGLEYHELSTLEKIRNFDRTSKIWRKEEKWEDIIEVEEN